MADLTHDRLVKMGVSWLKRYRGVDLVFGDVRQWAVREQPDVIGFTIRGHSIMIECKVSRADFCADRKKLWRRSPEWGMGEERFFLAPVGVITQEELPEGWGLLEAAGGRRPGRSAWILARYRTFPYLRPPRKPTAQR